MARICAAPGCERVAFAGPRCDLCELERQDKRRAFDKRRAADPHRKIYKTARWLRESRAFLAEHPRCADCAAAGIVEAARAVDHVIAVRVRPDLAFDASNWRPLCWSCHSRKTAREDAGFGRRKGGGGSEFRPPP
ncbi:HNH endonuclease signature motif containing protein [Neomegalonema perideroedes]|uniref:HNH endonuclease signature motif containing protein n=1 Tax=Neomegalonema perideroedes TaxID=217219 RepID=UPI0003638646|nr:HNH endonuclease signature motif containing protein [Neomegalonema perideroedes]